MIYKTAAQPAHKSYGRYFWRVPSILHAIDWFICIRSLEIATVKGSTASRHTTTLGQMPLGSMQ